MVVVQVVVALCRRLVLILCLQRSLQLVAVVVGFMERLLVHLVVQAAAVLVLTQTLARSLVEQGQPLKVVLVGLADLSSVLQPLAVAVVGQVVLDQTVLHLEETLAETEALVFRHP